MPVHRLSDQSESGAYAGDQQAKVEFRGMTAPEIVGAVGDKPAVALSNLLKGLHGSHTAIGTDREQAAIG